MEGPQGLAGAAPMSAATTTAITNLSPTAYSRKFYRKGFQTVTWSASDLNDDKRPDIVVSGKTGTWILLNEGKKRDSHQ